MQPDQPSDDLRDFLHSVLSSQNSQDETWRNMGRWMGLYFLGVLDADVETECALALAIGCQEAIMHMPRAEK